MKKRIISLLLMIFLFSGICALHANAVQLSSAFWPISNAFLESLNSGDDLGIVNNGKKLIAQLDKEVQTEQVVNIRATRLNQIAVALERLGRFEEAGYYHELYIPYAKKLGWTDGVRIAEEKVKEYKIDFDLYQLTNETVSYFGVPVEPKSGVLYGVTSDGPTRAMLPDESMTILYFEYGNRDFGWFDYRMKEIYEKGISVEVALNLPGEGNQIPQIPYDEEYIKTFLSHIAPFADTGIILRFGAEFNVWTVKTTPEQYVKAFRTVSNLTRMYAPGVALSWSPNQVSGWDINVDDYYPGDEYVDWVGVSAYALKYFMGRDDWNQNDKYNEIIFKTGDSAEAVRAIKKIVDTYGDRKPIMLSESGFSHFCNSLGRDTTDWAALQMKRAYNYLPMVYPQVKLIAHFDQSLPNEANNFSLSQNQTIQDLYKNLITLPTFIQGKNNSALTYKKLGSYITLNEPTLDISAYFYRYSDPEPTLHFYLDGTWVASSNIIPYTKSISFAGCKEGEHTLTIKAGNGFEKTYTVNYIKSNNSFVRVYYNGGKVISDANARIISGSTLVPIRAIAERMGFTVEWDENQRKVTLQDNHKKVELYINNNTIYVDGIPKEILVSPQIIENRTFLPLRAVTEAFGAKVEWDANTKSVYITR